MKKTSSSLNMSSILHAGNQPSAHQASTAQSTSNRSAATTASHR
jgi:hypothetical protein